MNELIEFSLDTENGEKNYALAQWYEIQGHTAPAHTYYLRAAERTEDNLLSYSALIRASFCYKSQGSRDGTEKVLLENALNFLPQRPEAYYFLSLLYERKKEWQNSYTYANLGLQQEDVEPIIPEFQGNHLLIFQKAVAAWWWGRGIESIKLFNSLIDNHWNEMDDKHKNSTKDNITRLNKLLSQKYFAEYKTDKYIRETFFSDYSYKGVMVEVGAGPPTFISNSKHFRDSGWRTISVEPNPKFVKQHIDEGSEVYQYACSDKEECRDFVVNLNNDEWYTEEDDGVSFSALDIRHKNLPKHNTQTTIEVETIRLDNLLKKINVEHVDILSIDVEGWELEVLRGLNKNKYQPKVIVIENIENDENYHSYMKERGYEFVQKCGCNEIYFKTPKNESKVVLNSKSKPTSWIVDNFYENPDEVRKFALEQEYDIGGIGRGYIGNRTHQQFLFPGLKEKFEEIMGKKITKWEEYGMNGRFQYCWSGQPLVYHCDNQKWGGMLYLTPDAPYQCGTTLYAHKQTRARTYYDEGWDDAWTNIPGDCHLDGTPFEPVDVLGNVYNRLVIFDASCIHSASEYFGTVKENCRLWQMFFFDT